MDNIKFSVGYNQDVRFFDSILSFKEHVSSIYFPLPFDIAASGRSFSQKEDYIEDIYKIISFCNDNGIISEALLNASCEGEDTCNKEYMDKVIKFLKFLEVKGLKRVITANSAYIRSLKKQTNLLVEASVIMNVNSLEKLSHISFLGADGVVLSAELNRNFKVLKDMRKKFSKMNIKLMANEGCVPGCPLRQTHFNFIAHHRRGGEMEGLFCEQYLKSKPESFFRIPIIRPEDSIRYKDVCDELKLVTRSRNSEDLFKILKAYSSGNFNGNLLELVDVQALRNHIVSIDNNKISWEDIMKVSDCDLNCDNCNECGELLRKTR